MSEEIGTGGDGGAPAGSSGTEGGTPAKEPAPSAPDWRVNEEYAKHFRDSYHADLLGGDEDAIADYLHRVAKSRGEAFAQKLAQKMGIASQAPQRPPTPQGQPTKDVSEANRRYLAKMLGIPVEDLARLPQIFSDHRTFTQSQDDSRMFEGIAAACAKIPIGEDKAIKDGLEELTYARFARGDVSDLGQAAREAAEKFNVVKAAIIKEYEAGKRGSRGLKAVSGGGSTGGGQRVKPSLKDSGPGSDWSDFIPDAEETAG